MALLFDNHFFTVSLHRENETLVAERQKELLEAGLRGPEQHHESRPPAVEAEGVHHLMSFAKMTGASVYIVHLSCEEALREAVTARLSGVDVRVETLIQYLLLDKTDAERPDFEGAKFVMSPPLRDKRNQPVLWDGLRSGIVDTVGTDHAPFDFKTQKPIRLNVNHPEAPRFVTLAHELIQLFCGHLGEFEGISPPRHGTSRGSGQVEAEATAFCIAKRFLGQAGLLVLLTAILLFSVPAHSVAQDILIGDFEEATYGSWMVTGSAFGSGPAQGTLPNQQQVTGFLGQRLVNSHHGGVSSSGTLTSPPFTIERSYIRFLIGGGNQRGRTCMNLLVNGQVVRSAVGMGDREQLTWLQWNVSSLIGSDASIQIVDSATGDWGSINVDHIFQTDTSLSARINLTHRYVNLPVRTGAPRKRLELIVDGLVAHEFNIELSDSDPDFWVFLDLGELQGKEAVVRIDSQLATASQLALLVQSDAIIDNHTFYKEALRPIYHYTARRGWLNDPCGLVFYNGEYHLGYQHNPYGWHWDNMHWGRAVSRNLVHWEELPEWLYPDPLGAMWSGSAVVDWNNTAGFGAEALVAFYTAGGGPSGVLPRMSNSERFTQCLAYSVDSGRTWTKYADNPILANVAGDNRDPKVFWYEPGNKWVMYLWLDGSDFGFFSSPDLKQWTQTSTFTFPGVIEVPDIFQLPLDGNANNLKWILYAGAGNYFIGAFDGNTFTPETGPFSIRGGNCFAATQTFSDIPAADGRRILIVHGTAQFPGMPFNNQMNFPVELTLRTTPSGARMHVNPVSELALLRVSTSTWPAQPLVAGKDPMSGTMGEAFELDVHFQPGAAERVSISLRGTEVIYDNQRQQVSCGDVTRSLIRVNGEVRLQILVDRGTVEIFGNDGRLYMPMRVIPVAGALPVSVSVTGNGAQLLSMSMHRLGSAWPDGPGSGLPVLLTQPSSVTSVSGNVVVFSVSAGGQEPLSYQWRKDGEAIAGATGSSLSIVADAANAGNYDVVVTNSAGTTNSHVAVLTVWAPYPIARWSMNPTGGNSPAVLDTHTNAGQGTYNLWTFNNHGDAFATSSEVPPPSMFANMNGGSSHSYDASTIANVDGVLFFPQDIYGDAFSFTGAFMVEMFFRTHGDKSGAGSMQLLKQGENDFRYGLRVNEAGPGSVSFTLSDGVITQSAILTGRNYAAGQWHYVLAIYNPGKSSNGVVRLTIMNEDGTGDTAETALTPTFGPLPIANDGNLFVGRNRFPRTQDHQTFIGLIDEVQISAGAPTSAAWQLGWIPPPAIIDVALDGEELTLTWSALSGETYVVEYASSLTDSPIAWIPIGTVVAASNVSTFTDTDPHRLSQPAGYYRLFVR